MFFNAFWVTWKWWRLTMKKSDLQPTNQPTTNIIWEFQSDYKSHGQPNVEKNWFLMRFTAFGWLQGWYGHAVSSTPSHRTFGVEFLVLGLLLSLWVEGSKKKDTILPTNWLHNFTLCTRTKSTFFSYSSIYLLIEWEK